MRDPPGRRPRFSETDGLRFCSAEAAKAYLGKVQPDMFELTLEEFLQGMRRKKPLWYLLLYYGSERRSLWRG